jgi:hypothetical protein
MLQTCAASTVGEFPNAISESGLPYSKSSLPVVANVKHWITIGEARSATRDLSRVGCCTRAHGMCAVDEQRSLALSQHP